MVRRKRIKIRPERLRAQGGIQRATPDAALGSPWPDSKWRPANADRSAVPELNRRRVVRSEVMLLVCRMWRIGWCGRMTY